MKKRRTAWGIYLVIANLVFVLAIIDPLRVAQSAFVKLNAQAEEAPDEMLVITEPLVPEKTTDATETNGTESVKSVLLEKENVRVKPVALSIMLEGKRIEFEIGNPEFYGEKFNETEEEENAEEWVDMHICVDVATIYQSPEGEALEDIGFTKKVQLSSEECKEGWAKIRLNDERVGYIKTENLMTPDQMLNNFQYLLAQIMSAEAESVGFWEMLLVGEVVIYRIVTTYWEFEPYCTTLKGVVSQPGQYPDTYRKIQNGLVPSEVAMEAAKMILLDEHEFLLPDGCLWQTGFYPSWNVEVVRYPGEWELDDGTVINVYHYYSVLAD